MLGDKAVHPREQSSIPMEHVSNPLSDQILEFYESELFPTTTAAETTIQNSEVGSSSNCCYDDVHSSYTTSSSGLSSFQAPDIIKYPPSLSVGAPIYNDNNSTTTTTTKEAPTCTDNFSIIFNDDELENDDINCNSVDIDFNLPPYQFGHHQEDQFDLTTLLQNRTYIPPLTTTTTDDNGPNPHPHHQNDHAVPVLGNTALLPTLSEDDDCSLSSVPAPSKFMRVNPPSSPPNCSFMDPTSHLNLYLSSGNSNPPTVETWGGIFGGNFFFGEVDFKGDNVGGIFCQDPLPTPPPYNSNELQTLSGESQHHLVNGGGVTCSHATPLTSEITSSSSSCLEAEPFRVTTKLTIEERKEKIHKYMKKRNQRNFSKKIKYACRKTLADSRPRVRGRFAKNDEFGENINIRTTYSNINEEDTDEDVKSFHVIVKEEEENFESSDIFAHISGVNSFKCNYPAIQSWI